MSGASDMCQPEDRPTLVCCLCGKAIDASIKRGPNRKTDEHILPKQFYPKSIRLQEKLNLWSCAHSHDKCNNGYEKDETYFYHSLCLLVANGNPQMGEVVLDDIRRRAQNPQSQAILRELLKTAQTETDGGIQLPAGIVKFSVDEYRIQRVAIKIAQCLFYMEHNHFLPRDSCKSIQLCENEQDVPEMFRLSWGLTEMVTVRPDIFSFKKVLLDGMHYYTLFFWEAFMFCMLFAGPVNLGGIEED